MTELNQADLFTGRAPVDEDLTPAQRMKMIRRRFGRCKTQTEDGRCTAWTTSDGQPMEITPERCLRCRGMTNAYFGDPGKPGAGLRGGGDSRRRAELEKLYPAEIEERIKGIQSGAGWAEGQLQRHYEKHGNDFATLDEYSEAVSHTIENPSRIVSKYYTQGGQEYCQWGLYSEETGLLVNVYQHNGHIGTAFPSRAWRRDGYTRPDVVEVTGG